MYISLLQVNLQRHQWLFIPSTLAVGQALAGLDHTTLSQTDLNGFTDYRQTFFGLSCQVGQETGALKTLKRLAQFEGLSHELIEAERGRVIEEIQNARSVIKSFNQNI